MYCQKQKVLELSGSPPTGIVYALNDRLSKSGYGASMCQSTVIKRSVSPDVHGCSRVPLVFASCLSDYCTPTATTSEYLQKLRVKPLKNSKKERSSRSKSIISSKNYKIEVIAVS